MANERKYQPHLKEAQMSNSLKNLANAVKSNATNLTNLKMANANLAEQLKVALAQKKFSLIYESKKSTAYQQKIQTIRTQININELIRQGGLRIAWARKKNIGIRLGVSEPADMKLNWATLTGRAALLV